MDTPENYRARQEALRQRVAEIATWLEEQDTAWKMANMGDDDDDDDTLLEDE